LCHHGLTGLAAKLIERPFQEGRYPWAA
jgi:hypothetical protein